MALTSADEESEMLENVYGYPETSCYQASSAVKQNSMSDYQSSLSVDASVSGGASFGIGSFSFSASVATNSFQREVVDTRSERYTLTSYCLQYFAAFRKSDHVTLQPLQQFLDEVAFLPIITAENDTNVTPDEIAQWNHFFSTFGTHCKFLVFCLSSIRVLYSVVYYFVCRH